MHTVEIGAGRLKVHIISLLILVAFGAFVKRLDLQTPWQLTGLVTFSVGFALLGAYALAGVLKMAKLPMISGYIFAGIIAGPHVTGFLDMEMVRGFRLIDDLALSFIAMSAGGALHFRVLKQRRNAILLNIGLQTLIVFWMVFLFIFLAGHNFRMIAELSGHQILALALLLGIIAIARSPSSAIAIISECRAKGPFTETALGVTVAIDVVIIVLFTTGITLSRMILGGSADIAYGHFVALFCSISASLLVGGIIGRMIAAYIRRIGHDLTLFLLFIAFGVTKFCIVFNAFTEAQFQIHFNLEPLMVCMSAGFVVQNFSKTGETLMSTLEAISLPIYVFFFFVSGASLNLYALRICWPLALGLAVVRTAAIFASTYLAGSLNHDPPPFVRCAWMAYLTQAGVSLGLAQLARAQLPEIGTLVSTLVLAVITVNQIVGPIVFKSALNLVGEAQKA